MDDRTAKALVAAIVWLAIVLAVRWTLGRAYDRYEQRLAERTPAEAAQRRTTFGLLRRLIVAVVALIGIWNVLSIYPQTDELARAMLASSAVLALLVGLAFSTPLSNLGSGLLVAFSQPLRLGDRVTVLQNTGYVEEITLSYTTLRTDDDRRVFIPNSQLTSAPIVNRTIRDPRRAVSVSLPVRLDAPLEKVSSTLQRAADEVAGTIDGPRVLVTDISAGSTWFTVTVYAPLDADVARIESDLRTVGLRTLAGSGFLPDA